MWRFISKGGPWVWDQWWILFIISQCTTVALDWSFKHSKNKFALGLGGNGVGILLLLLAIYVNAEVVEDVESEETA